jgi:hypothetical protein
MKRVRRPRSIINKSRTDGLATRVTCRGDLLYGRWIPPPYLDAALKNVRSVRCIVSEMLGGINTDEDQKDRIRHGTNHRVCY